MSDRRQGDRREGSENTKITISLTSFIYIIIIFVIVILSILFSRLLYKKGYNDGYIISNDEFYYSGYDAGYNDGYTNAENDFLEENTYLNNDVTVTEDSAE